MSIGPRPVGACRRHLLGRQPTGRGVDGRHASDDLDLPRPTPPGSRSGTEKGVTWAAVTDQHFANSAFPKSIAERASRTIWK